MNEVDFIRLQVLTEQQHARQVFEWCRARAGSMTDAGAFDENIYYFIKRCIEYLTVFMRREAARSRAHSATLRVRTGGSEPAEPAELSAVLVRLDAAADTASCLTRRLDGLTRAAALDSGALEQELRLVGQHLSVQFELSERLRELADGHYSIADWRRIGGLDADGILEERRCYRELDGQRA